ncbi:MAG: 3',5'-cyclic-nucleotide phosphodiesterase [Enhydrobacter sp.]|nr:3',5'-cyclic-nucleotide phosphodiesterase [Enhydrobacter sp.]
MKSRALLLVAALAAGCLSVARMGHAADGFDIVTLGALGGIQDGNLTAYLVHPHGDDRAVTFDVGTLVNGLMAADQKGAFDGMPVPPDSRLGRVGYVMTDRIKGYLVSHAHLDHVAGLVIASPDDSRKPIYALPSVNAVLVDTYFNWQAWPNFTDRGKAPQLKKYALQDLTPGVPVPILDTGMRVTAFPLSHGGVESTAFVVENDGDVVVYFGDTGPDAVEKSTKMRGVWSAVADKARQRKLKAILIESSYASDRPDAQLFGHLTPKWIMKSLRELDELAGGRALKDLPVVITHIKYSLTREQPQARIERELAAENDLGVRFLIPQPGSRWHFK